jgi:uncharacterized protein (DUF2267 family)
MSRTGLDVFDTTLQKTNVWLKDLMELLHWPDKHRPYLALRATLHAIRDAITVDEVAHLGAQLPMLIRGFYYEGWDPVDNDKLRHEHHGERQREQFLAQIKRPFRPDDGIDPWEVANAVFTVLARHISKGEIADVKQMLPGRIRELWP